jgi:hypothetical protein
VKKYNKFLSFLSLLAFCSCSSIKTDPFDPSSLNAGLDTIKDSETSYGPTKKELTGFVDKTSEYGLDGLIATNFSLVDLDRDGFTDIMILPEYFSQPKFLRYNIHKEKFEKMDSPFIGNVKASYVLFYDLNNDKILDAIVGVLNQKTEMAQNPIRIFRGSYENKKLVLREEEGVIPAAPAPSASVGLIDFDLDGDLDLYIANWFQKTKEGTFPHRDYLLKNDKGTYTDVTEIMLGETKQNESKTMYINSIPSFATQICDIDQNGFPDILTTGTNGYANRLWMNRYKVREKNRYFQDYGRVSLFGGDTEGNLTPKGGGRSFSVACHDYNEDGIMDLFLGEISHNYDNEIKDKSSILSGSTFKFPPFFMRTEYFLDADDIKWHQADRRAIWFDYNNDGLLDLLVDNAGFPPHSRMILFKQYPDHSFESVAKEVGVDIVNPQSTVIADLNRDGKMDIITAQTNLRDASIKKRIYVFENNVKTGKSIPLRLYLRGQKSNYHGLNATVIVKVLKDKKFTIRKQNVSYSYGGLPPQNEEGLLFALAEGESIDYIKVRWPYTKTLNQSRAGLEKVYKVKKEYMKAINITLCENGDYLVGRLPCKD